MHPSPSSRSSVVVAELGPTNTGKTHRAIERMLEHDSGMMGLPLRLLAREVYDRVTARVGEGRVALMTGEEKRLPPRPDYWICTVEAMPTDSGSSSAPASSERVSGSVCANIDGAVMNWVKAPSTGGVA